MCQGSARWSQRDERLQSNCQILAKEGYLSVPLTPLLDVLDIIIAVLQSSTSFVLVGVQNRRPGLLSGFQWGCPRSYGISLAMNNLFRMNEHTVLNACGNVVRAGICLGRR